MNPLSPGSIVRINSLKYPNRPHYSWESEVMVVGEDFVIVHSHPGRTLYHYTRGENFKKLYHAIEFFSTKEWFTASITLDESLQPISHYCNVALPAKFEKNSISFIDLDLDYVQPKFDFWQVVDEDEFEENKILLGYTEEMKERAPIELDSLVSRVQNGRFPFDGSLLELIQKKPAG